MLDLSKKKYYELVLHDGTELKILPPTMEIYATLKDVYDHPAQTGEEEVRALVKQVLEANKKRIPITEEQMAEFDLKDMNDVLFDYTEFVKQLASDPN